MLKIRSESARKIFELTPQRWVVKHSLRVRFSGRDGKIPRFVVAICKVVVIDDSVVIIESWQGASHELFTLRTPPLKWRSPLPLIHVYSLVFILFCITLTPILKVYTIRRPTADLWGVYGIIEAGKYCTNIGCEWSHI